MRKSKWTLEACKKEAKKYKTRSEWFKAKNSGYSAAYKRGWIDVCTKHMISLRKPNNYWTLKRCKEEAKKYSARSLWQKAEGGSYIAARKKGWLDKCCSHMDSSTLNLKRMLYVFFDENEKYAYVGLSGVLDRRFQTHLNTKKEFMSSLKKGNLCFVSDFNLYSEKTAQKLEASLISEFSLKYRMLNKNKAGSLGGNVKYWTLERCKSDALKYTYRNQWRERSEGAYASARKHGWLNLCCAHMKTIQKTRTFEECKKIAKTFNSKKQWRESDARSYEYSIRKGWLPLFSHLKSEKTPVSFWTLEKCKKDALKHESKTQWARSNSASYKASLKNDWMDKCCSHMPDPNLSRRKWTLEKCKKDALKHKSKNQWRIAKKSGYHAALTHGWLDQCCRHMDQNSEILKKTRNKNLFKRDEKAALKCEYLVDFMKKYPLEYKSAMKQGWYKKITSHMKAYKPKLSFEQCLKIARKYPTLSLWKKSPKSGYHVALRMGWLKECSSHMVKSIKPLKWSFQNCQKEAKKYKTRIEFHKKSLAYASACRNGWIDQICSHMKSTKELQCKWNINNCTALALNYKTKSEFIEQNSGAYDAILRNNWSRKVFSHMPTRSEVFAMKRGLKSRSK